MQGVDEYDQNGDIQGYYIRLTNMDTNVTLDYIGSDGNVYKYEIDDSPLLVTSSYIVTLSAYNKVGNSPKSVLRIDKKAQSECPLISPQNNRKAQFYFGQIFILYYVAFQGVIHGILIFKFVYWYVIPSGAGPCKLNRNKMC